MRFFSLLLLTFPLFVVAQAPTVVQPGQDPGVRVQLDSLVLAPQEEYVLQRDMPYSLQVYDLQPGTTVDIKVKFAGGLGRKKAQKDVPENGIIFYVFDTPDKSAKADATVEYTPADGTRRQVNFTIRTE